MSKVCPNCGSENRDNAKFCDNCGTLLPFNEEIKEGSVNPESTGKEQASDSVTGKKNPKNSNSKALKLGLILGCICVVIVIAVIATRPKVTRITAAYNGSGKEGETLETGDNNIVVTAYYENDKSKKIRNWKIENPETLKADETSDVVVSYHDQETSLSVQCTTSAPESLTLSYSGSTKAGTTIDNNNDGLTGTVLYKNGTKEEIASQDLKISSPETLEKDGKVTVNATYKGLASSIDITCSDRTPVSLQAAYSGGTEEGTTIDSGNGAMKVTVTYKDGSTEDVSDWTVASPVTLAADQKSTVEIHYGDLSTTVEVQCSTISPDNYKASCGTISYEDLARNPDSNEGQKYQFTGQVVQVMDADFGRKIYRVNVTPTSYGGYEDTVMVLYSPQEGDTNILEDDIITFYGESEGNTTYTAIFGQEITIPCISAEYIELH
ncbi:MAG: zinc-ribbon domain-containing protein [Bilifractor sp.]